MLINAATADDSYVYHTDADPTSFPDDSTWVRTFGDYFNGEPGKPLLVSLLVYLNDSWDKDHAGDTLVLDAGTDTGIFIRPKPGRAVLMNQDVLHRLSPPSLLAGKLPRYSVVWKLVFVPKHKGVSTNSIARPEWGKPTAFGTASKVEGVVRQMYRDTRSH